MSYELLIRETHLDTFGHVNNATYLQIYEEARWDLITENGFGLKEIQSRGQGPVILEAHVKFKRELHLREKIVVTTELVKYEGKIAVLAQKMLKEDGGIASEAIFTVAFFDTKLRKLIEPTPEWNRALGRS